MAKKNNTIWWIIGVIVVLVILVGGGFGIFAGTREKVCMVEVQEGCKLINGQIECSGVGTIEEQAHAMCNVYRKISNTPCQKQICFPEDCQDSIASTGETCPFEGCQTFNGKLVTCIGITGP